MVLPLLGHQRDAGLVSRAQLPDGDTAAIAANHAPGRYLSHPEAEFSRGVRRQDEMPLLGVFTLSIAVFVAVSPRSFTCSLRTCICD